MRDFKKLPQAAAVSGESLTDLDLPYNAISGDGQGGFSMGEVPYGADNGGQHGDPFTFTPSLVRAGRT
jgi:hypothetical protein